MQTLWDQPAVKVREWYRPIAQQWNQAQAGCLGEIRLIVDGTKVGFAHQLLMVRLAYRNRAVPIAWSWVEYVSGHSCSKHQISLLKYVGTLLPKKYPFLWSETANLARFRFFGS